MGVDFVVFPVLGLQEEPSEYRAVLEIINFVFTGLFIIEAVLKVWCPACHTWSGWTLRYWACSSLGLE